MAGGRPTLYKEEYCQQLIDHMGSGLSFESFAGLIGTCRDTLYNWKKEHSEFFDAHKKGIEKNLIWWEKVGLEGMFMGGKDNPFNAAVYCFNMKNRHGWKDRVESEVKETSEKIVTVKRAD